MMLLLSFSSRSCCCHWCSIDFLVLLQKYEPIGILMKYMNTYLSKVLKQLVALLQGGGIEIRLFSVSQFFHLSVASRIGIAKCFASIILMVTNNHL